MIEWDKLEYIPSYLNFNINKFNIPSNNKYLTKDNLADLNELLGDLFKRKVYRGSFTKSGALKKDMHTKKECYWINCQNTGVQIIYRKPHKGILCDFNIVYGANDKNEKKYISGGKCWNKFVKILKKFNVYDILLEHIITPEEGLRIKSEIEKPIIELAEAVSGRTYQHVYHLDINSSFMAAIANKWGFLKEPIEFMYKERKKTPIYKDILTHTYGFMQSYYLGGYLHLKDRGAYGLSQMSHEALRANNEQIRLYSKQAVEKGYKILAYNTDGFYYQDTNNLGPFHNDMEGFGLGQWKNDIKNATIRFKSAGSYEYIDGDGNYHPVVRGTTILDRIKPREQWKWGDIMLNEANEIKYTLVDIPGCPLRVFDYEK